MEKLLLALGCLLVAALAGLKLRELLRWARCEAVVSGLPGLSGRNLPIAFHLKDGSPANATLRDYGRAGARSAGERLRILYNLSDPRQVEWEATRLVVALSLAAMVAVALGILAS